MREEIIENFLQVFTHTHLQDIELKISNTEVREFLKKQADDITFNQFNKISHCMGRSTDNKYVYSIPVLMGQLTGEKEGGIQRAFTENRIKTLSWYGSKRNWIREWHILLSLASREHGCRRIVDCFGGSGFISLLAARLGCFDEVILNDSSSLIYNFHSVMKNKQQFEQFIARLDALGSVSKETFHLLYEHLHGTYSSFVGCEKRRQVKVASVERAVELFVTRHYSYDGQGSYVARRKEPAAYIDSLKKTHRLYGAVELRHLHYMKLLKSYMGQEDTLIILDPPYISEVRVQKQSYGKEFSRSQHKNMLQLLTKETVTARVMVCGYSSAFYDGYFLRASQTWHCLRLRRPSKRGSGGEGKECLWFNFNMAESIVEYEEMFDLVY